MKKILTFLKNEPMLWLSVLAALLSFLITPPSKDIFSRIDWHTLGTLFMMLIVLEGFKQENIFRPIIRLTSKFSSIAVLSLFLIFGVFFSSMFVTNDVSLFSSRLQFCFSVRAIKKNTSSPSSPWRILQPSEAPC